MSLAVAKTRSRRSMTAFRERSELAGFVNCQPLQVAAIEGAAPRTTSPSGRGRHEPTSAALISRPRSCRSDSHTGKDLPNRRDATAPAQESTSPGHRRPIPRRASNPTTLKLPREGSQCRGPAARCRRIALCSQIARATPRLRCHADGELSTARPPATPGRPAGQVIGWAGLFADAQTSLAHPRSFATLIAHRALPRAVHVAHLPVVGQLFITHRPLRGPSQEFQDGQALAAEVGCF